MKKMELDVLIFGGGVAGLWLLDELRRRGYAAVLLEAKALGAGQTIASQGILHGGLKYSLGGLIDSASKAVAEMPHRWKSSLAGHQPPNLRAVRVLSEHCHLWRTDSLASRAGLIAAQAVIRTPVHKTLVHERPMVLSRCPGEVLRVEEQVIDCRSLMDQFLKLHNHWILKISKSTPVIDRVGQNGLTISVSLEEGASPLGFHARNMVLVAGEGNADLRLAAGLDVDAMQCRPLHMVMVRGKLPLLFGHCIDGNKTRATITSNTDSKGNTVWVVGGEVSEKGVGFVREKLIEHARKDLQQILPGVDLGDTQWATYRINRAEAQMPGNRRPDDAVWRKEGCTITAWPTKLVLAPHLASQIADLLPAPSGLPLPVIPDHWPRPVAAVPPWEAVQEWTH